MTDKERDRIECAIRHIQTAVDVDPWAAEIAVAAMRELFGNSEQLDTISRAAAINAICEDGTQLERQGQYTMTMAERKQRDADILDALPSAQTGRKKGKWLPDNNNYYEERFICSVCGKSYKVDTCMGKPMWNFCPCGADMRKGGEGND